jgi:hypothetical protein
MESGISRSGQIACTGEPFHDNADIRLICHAPCLKPDTGTSLLYGMTIGLLHKFLRLFQTRRCRTSIKHTENNHAVRKNGKNPQNCENADSPSNSPTGKMRKKRIICAPVHVRKNIPIHCHTHVQTPSQNTDPVTGNMKTNLARKIPEITADRLHK